MEGIEDVLKNKASVVVTILILALTMVAVSCSPAVTPAQSTQGSLLLSNNVFTLSGSPWPTFRHDSRNTGSSSIRAAYTGDKPWMFQTGKGIFSTPVIDDKGTVYVGSADHFFYALNADGSLKWKYQTGEIIDSAGRVGRFRSV